MEREAVVAGIGAVAVRSPASGADVQLDVASDPLAAFVRQDGVAEVGACGAAWSPLEDQRVARAIIRAQPPAQPCAVPPLRDQTLPRAGAGPLPPIVSSRSSRFSRRQVPKE